MFDEKEYKHKWYLRNREKTIERSRLWRKNHPERARELSRKYARRYREKYPEKAKELRRLDYYKHREKRKQTKKGWYEKNRERELILMKKWREEHEEYRREWWSKYYEENKERLLERHRKWCDRKRREMGIPKWGSKEHLRKWCVSNHIKPNKAERQLINLFKDYDLPFRFVGDGQVVINGKIPDFINYNGGKQIIELFGDYWHEPEEEEERKKVFAEFGYETLIIWEHELKNEDTVFSKIKSWLGGDVNG